MRVSFFKFHCPSFICFCKPSSHLLSPYPLQIENTPHVSSTLSSNPKAAGQLSDEKADVKRESIDGKEQLEDFPKSSIKKPPSESGTPEVAEKRRVQWMDILGKELVEIKEFEPSESGDLDDEGEGNRGCVCVIQ